MSMNILTLNGISSPNCFVNGKTQQSYREDKLTENIRNMLSTLEGSIYGAPEWGSRLQEILFDPSSSGNGELIRQEIIRCIEKSYPLLNLEAVDISLGDLYINCKIYYKLYNSDLSVKLEFDISRGVDDDTL